MIRAALSRPWDEAYTNGDATVSWAQQRPERSLAAIAAVAPSLKAPILDVGGGSSSLAGELLEAGHTGVSVLDLSEQALDLARGRLGERGKRIDWIAADPLDWQTPRRYAVWHDRAVLHVFTGDEERERYADRLREALQPGGHAIIATFAPDGPTSCSGLEVRCSSLTRCSLCSATSSSSSKPSARRTERPAARCGPSPGWSLNAAADPRAPG